MKKILFALGILGCSLSIQAQNKTVKFHSHNDYDRNVPFWNAYAQGMHSIEIDLVLADNALFVAHDLEDRQANRTIETLYLKPLQQAVELHFGNPSGLQFLIDLKGDAHQSMALLAPILKKYEDLIVQQNLVFVISGNKPELSYFIGLPSYIQVDLQVQDTFKNETALADKIGLVSYNFQSISTWKGQGKLDKKEEDQLKQLIVKAHQMNKPIRFWATPDTPEAWQLLSQLNVDFINTDQPAALHLFFKKEIQ